MSNFQKYLFWGSNAWYFAEGMLGPFFAVFAGRVGGDILDISYAWAIFWAVTGVVAIFSGKLGDHFGKARVLFFGSVLTVITTFGYLLVKAPIHLFIIQALSGVAMATLNPSWYALYGEHSSRKTSGSAWGWADGSGRLFSATAILIGGVVIKEFSFTTLFLIMGCIHTLGMLYQAQILFIQPKADQ